MKKFVFSLIAMGLFTLSSNAQIRSDYDKDVDFSQYKTIQFLGWQDGSDQLVDDNNKKRIYEAFKKEFSAKGFELVESDGDLGLTFYIVIDQKTSTSAYTDYYGGMGYGSYRRGGWGWGNGSSTTTYTERDYLEGTFIVDFYDANTEKQVWQGVSTNTISENPKKRAKNIPKRVTKLMKKLPPEK